jgi:membrane-associated protein
MTETIIAFGYAAIFINIVLEIGLFIFPLPADSLLFTAGILVEAGKLDLYILLSVVMVASIFGGHLGYYIGKKFGRERIKHNRFFTIDEAHLHRAERFFDRFGPLAIIVSRFVPIVRTLISPTLGIINYDKYKFATYNTIASVVWAVSIIWAGMVVGKMFPNFIKYTEFVVLTAVFVVSLPLIYPAVKKAFSKFKK